jgi:hypothetical protein
MKIIMEVAINMSIEDNTAAASEHSELGIDSWTLSGCITKINVNNCMHA